MAFNYIGWSHRIELDFSNSILNLSNAILDSINDIKELKHNSVTVSYDLNNIHNIIKSNDIKATNHINYIYSLINNSETGISSEIESLNELVETNYQDLDTKIYDINTDLTSKIDDVNTDLTSKINTKILDISEKTGADELDYAFTTVQTLNNLLEHNNRLNSLDHRNLVVSYDLKNIHNELKSNYNFTKNHTKNIPTNNRNFGNSLINIKHVIYSHFLKLEDLFNFKNFVNSRLDIINRDVDINLNRTRQLSNKLSNHSIDFTTSVSILLNKVHANILDIKTLFHSVTIINSNINNIYNNLKSNYEYTKNHLDYVKDHYTKKRLPIHNFTDDNITDINNNILLYNYYFIDLNLPENNNYTINILNNIQLSNGDWFVISNKSETNTIILSSPFEDDIDILPIKTLKFIFNNNSWEILNYASN